MGGLVALLAAAVVLVVLAIATARRPAAPIPDRDGYLTAWRALHGNYDPRGNPWVRGWLTLSYRAARPLARLGVAPDVVTLGTVWLAAGVLVPAAAGGRWPMLAGWLLVLSGLGDGIDGCVAVLTDRATRWGYVLDSTVDRVNEVLYLLAVVAVGAPPALAAAAGVAFGMLEYVRARAVGAGMDEVGIVTVGERAMRVILCGAGLFAAGLLPGSAGLVAAVALGALAVVSVAGLGQLLWVVRRRLVRLPGRAGPVR
jgi:CDP-diacylglycerol--glycerol-3-phosphate 3-phosphatidyltransferase